MVPRIWIVYFGLSMSEVRADHRNSGRQTFVQEECSSREPSKSSPSRTRLRLPLTTMFQKQFTAKSGAPLRRSDRQKLGESLVSKFHLERSLAGPTSKGTGALVELLMPNGLKSMKYTASANVNGVNDPSFFLQ